MTQTQGTILIVLTGASLAVSLGAIGGAIFFGLRTKKKIEKIKAESEAKVQKYKDAFKGFAAGLADI